MSLNGHYKYIHCITSKTKLWGRNYLVSELEKMTKPLVELTDLWSLSVCRIWASSILLATSFPQCWIRSRPGSVISSKFKYFKGTVYVILSDPPPQLIIV